MQQHAIACCYVFFSSRCLGRVHVTVDSLCLGRSRRGRSHGHGRCGTITDKLLRPRIRHRNYGLRFSTGRRWDSLTNATSGVDYTLEYLSSGDLAGYTLLTVLTLGSPDFNGDGIVDAADYTVWRDGLGTSYIMTDYARWKANYGATVSNLPAVPQQAVPEPRSLGLLGLAFTSLLWCHRKSNALRITGRQNGRQNG